MTRHDIIVYSVGVLIAVGVLYGLFRALAHAWYAEKRKHLDRVIKKLEE